jgi:UDP-N-acetylmuramyl tripeptide synthase
MNPAPGDFVIVAGKGNEEYLVQGDERTPFDYVEVVKEV